MKCKHFKKMTGLILTTVLTVAATLSTSITSRAAETIIVSPSNVLNVQVVDEEGNDVSGIEASLVHSSGVEYAEWNTNTNKAEERNNSGVKKADFFNVPRSYFEELVAPYTLYQIRKTGTEMTYDDYVQFNSVTKTRDLSLEYYKDLGETAFSVPADTVVVNADSEWADGSFVLGLKLEDTEYSINNMAGTMQSFSAPESGEVYLRTSIGGWWNSYYPETLDTNAAEYVKARVKLSDIARDVNEDGTFNVREGKPVSIASDTGNGDAALRIISGSVINYPVPDDEGYVEFYVLKSVPKYELIIYAVYSDGYTSGSGGTGDNGVLTEAKEVTLQSVDYPSTGTTMMYVPAGEYTINLANVPAEYETPNPVSYTVVDQKEVQTCKIVLKKQTHQHSYGNTYETDADNHWYECACGDKKDLAAHTPGAAATETTDQVCTVCNYVITPALGHQHSYGSTYETDANNHWYECACGDKKDLAAHTPGAAATETTDQVCTVCNYVITPALGHQHSYSSTYKTDADNHWKACACGDKTEEAAHSFDWVIDKEATVDAPGAKHEECSVCAYEKASVEIPQLKAEVEEDKPVVDDTPVVDEDEEDDDDEDEEETVAPAYAVSPKTAEDRSLWACLFAGFVLATGMASYCYKKENKQ